jgi:hypothetical protein
MFLLSKENISLTFAQRDVNCGRIRLNADINVGDRCKQAEEYKKQDASYMERHLRGELLERCTRVVRRGSGNALIATREIPVASILGLYFGETRVAASEAEAAISKMHSLRLVDGSVRNVNVVGMLDGKQTLPATMNHALPAHAIKQQYHFVDDKAKTQAAAANVCVDYFCVTYQESKHAAPVEMQVETFVAQTTIKADHALMWDYWATPSPLFSALFSCCRAGMQDEFDCFSSRGLTPFLFTRQGDFLPRELYFPTQFNILLNHRPVRIPYQLTLQLISDDKNSYKQQKYTSKDISNIQQALNDTGFFSPQGKSAIKRKVEIEENKPWLKGKAAIVLFLMWAMFRYLSSRPVFFSTTNIAAAPVILFLAHLYGNSVNNDLAADRPTKALTL